MVYKHKIYNVRDDVRCTACGCKGAVQYAGTYYPHGMKEELDKYEKDSVVAKAYEKYRNQCYVSPAIGFGGTIPYRCMNCDNTGLIDIHGLEGYKKAFETIKDESGSK